MLTSIERQNIPKEKINKSKVFFGEVVSLRVCYAKFSGVVW